MLRLALCLSMGHFWRKFHEVLRRTYISLHLGEMFSVSEILSSIACILLAKLASVVLFTFPNFHFQGSLSFVPHLSQHILQTDKL